MLGASSSEWSRSGGAQAERVGLAQPDALEQVGLGEDFGRGTAGGFDWALAFRHTGPMRVLNNNSGTFVRVGSFLVVDLSLGRHFSLLGRECLVQIGVRNLTDDRQRDLESGALRDSDYVNGPRAPRTFFTSAKLAW